MVRTKKTQRPKTPVFEMPGKRINCSRVYTDNTHVYSLIGQPRKRDGAQRLRCCNYKSAGCKGTAYLYPGSLMSKNHPHSCNSTTAAVDGRKLATAVKEEVLKNEQTVTKTYDTVKTDFSTEAETHARFDTMESNLYKIKKKKIPKSWECGQCSDWLDNGGQKPSMLLPCGDILCNDCTIEAVIDAVCPLCGKKVQSVNMIKAFPSRPK